MYWANNIQGGKTQSFLLITYIQHFKKKLQKFWLQKIPNELCFALLN